MDKNSDVIKSKTQAEKESDVLKFWQENNIFEKSVSMNKGDGKSNNFVFYDGPPFATGLPHHGHLLQSFMKDSVPRYQTMNGKSVRRVWGWDCHGLPIENMIEKELGLKSKKEIEEYGLDKFYKACADSVLRYEKDWKGIVPRLGRWIDMDKCYKTMDATYTESVWWAFSELYKKGLAYEGYKVMHVCPRCETPLAQSEVALGGYKDVTDISVYVPFEFLDLPGTYMLAWTTTPWTLPGNTAIAVNAGLEYVKVKVMDETGTEKIYILCEKFVQKLFIDKKIECEIVGKVMGSELVGKSYKPVFEYYVNADIKNKENIYKVWHADFVNDEIGTGIAHEAPAFGEDDMALAVANEIPVIKHVKMNGEFEDEVTDLKGIKVKQKDDTQTADIEVIKWLAHNGKLFAKEKIVHAYPHCWRCDTPLLNYATSSWFVAVSKMRGELLSENETINWIPDNVKNGRFGKWLEGARDWAVSRNRYWGAPLPIWKSSDGEIFVPGSLKELKARIAKRNNYTFIRHGETQANLTTTINTDLYTKDTLTDKGIKQVAVSAQELKNKNIDLIIYSPYERTRHTAQIIKESLGMSNAQMIADNRLVEWQVGEEYEGKNWLDVLSEEEHKNKNLFFDKLSQDGESRYEMSVRMANVMYNLDEKYEGKNILLVSHSSAICAAALYAEGDVYNKNNNEKSPKWTHYDNAELVEVDFRSFPYDESGEINFHIPFIDKVKVLDDNGNLMTKSGGVFDCWYESGSMSYAQFHFPFENKELFDTNYPANFIGEGTDQTRGWFYTLLILGVSLFGKKSFENVLCTGLVMAEDGKKMSKSLKNFTDPMELIDLYGSDAMRYYMMSSPIVKGENIKFTDKGLSDVYKKNVSRLINVLAMYNLFKDDSVTANDYSTHILDLYIIARLRQVKSEVTQGFESYELDKAFRPIEGFIEDLSVWYVRRSRDRIKSDDINIRNESLATFKFVLFELSKVMAPIMPFLAEIIYQDTKESSELVESVHLSSWGTVSELSIDEIQIIKNTDEARALISLILDERTKVGINVRQPLSKVTVDKTFDPKGLNINRGNLLFEIKDETNVKEIAFADVDNWLRPVLDINISEELKIEGAIREFIRGLQDTRKSMKLSTKDKVHLNIHSGLDYLKIIIDENINILKDQCNIVKINFSFNEDDCINISEIDFLNHKFKFSLTVQK
jgi:isoleucyl-tRNA synthetase